MKKYILIIFAAFLLLAVSIIPDFKNVYVSNRVIVGDTISLLAYPHPAGSILTSDSAGNGKWSTAAYGTPVFDSIATNDATVSLAVNTSYIIQSSGAIDTATLTFPQGATGNWITIEFNRAIIVLINSGVNAGAITNTSPSKGTSKTYLNYNGSWY